MYRLGIDLGGTNIAAAVVDGELDKHQIGILREQILLQPEDAEIAAGAADSPLDGVDFAVRILCAQPCRRPLTPAAFAP